MSNNNNGQVSLSFQEPIRKKIQNYSFSLKDKLGSGYSSEVFKGLNDLTKKIVAIKVVNLARLRSKGLEELLHRQIRLLKLINHQNIIGCLDVLMTTNNCYMVTEYCPEGDLASVLTRKGRFSHHEGLQLAQGICDGLAFLHANGVMHRDIKPQNILIHGNMSKIGDFGFALCSDKPTKQKYTIGSPLYMGPEALTRREYSTKNDIWGLGVTMYEIFEGRAPWGAQNEKQLRQTIKGELKFKYIRSTNLQNLIKGCMNYNENLRLSATEVQSKLEELRGVTSIVNISWQTTQNKQNSERGNHGQVQESQVKKAMRMNYNFLKWLINYSRFSAKLLPKIQEHLDCQIEVKKPIVEMAARVLHLTISNLNRIQQVYEQLGLTYFQRFCQTTRYSKIKAVTAEYHQKYLLLLTKLPYKYQAPQGLKIDFPAKFVESLNKVKISLNCPLNHLMAIDFLITLGLVVREGKQFSPQKLSQTFDFEKLAEFRSQNYSEQKIEQLIEKRKKISEFLNIQ